MSFVENEWISFHSHSFSITYFVYASTNQALYERGQKLSELEERTAQMMANAENFQQAASQIMQKYKDKKWYQFWDCPPTEGGIYVSMHLCQREVF